MIPTNSVWSYRKGTAEASTPVEAWRALDFDDSSWPRSAAPFYYDTDTSDNYTGNTLLSDMNGNYTCLFLRRAMVVETAAALDNLALKFRCDDGFVLWLNGQEVYCYNVSAGAAVYTNTTPSGIAKAVFTNLTLAGAEAYLTDGTNIVALQVFNRAKTNRDFFIDLELSARVQESIPPTLVGCDPASGKVTHLNQVTVTFSEPVMGVAAEDLLVNGQPATAVTGSGASYTFGFPQPAYGVVTAVLDPEHGITDLASNRLVGDLALGTYTLVDEAPPQVALVNPPRGAIVRQLSQVEIRFTEPVANLDAADLLVNGRPADTVTGSASGPFVFQFAGPATGTVVFAWAPNHGITDTAQPSNAFAGESWTVTYDPQAIIPSVRINEFVATSVNPNRLKDEEGELQGWIELYNAGSNTVSLAGWALTDSAGAPDRWVFPDVMIPAGGFLVVFASGKDRRPVKGNLHTNFKLNPAGEYLGLYNNESPRRVVSEFTPEFPDQRNDYSYGMDPAGEWRYYAVPSPGARNGASSIAGVAKPVHFSVERGLYELPFQLRLSTLTSNAVIRFTVDGTVPTESSGQVYGQPLEVKQTTTLRAAAFRSDLLPSQVRTHTYVFPAAVLRQPADPAGFPLATSWSSYGIPSDYAMDPQIVDDPQYQSLMVPALLALPALSIVMRTDQMFGEANGLYTHAGSSSLEAACSVELVHPDGQPGFQIDGSIQMHGGGSRMRTMKHSFHLRFKSEFGPTKLNFPFFPDSPVTEFDTIVLRADYNNHWTHGFDVSQRSRGQLVREAWFKDAHAAMGAVSSHSRYVHLYINGLYWGLYNPSERPDGDFGVSYFGGSKEDYDAINGTEPNPPLDGNAAARNTMLGIGNLENPAQYALMRQYLDVPQYIDYQILLWYGANQDWGTTKNWYSIRRRHPGAGFLYLCWDNERTLEGVNENRLGTSADDLHAKLAANADYRVEFGDRVHKHFFNSGALTTNAVIQGWTRRAAQLDTAIVAESARWGDSMAKSALNPPPYPTYIPGTPYNRNNDWLGEQGRLLTNYFPYRSAIVLNQLRAAGLYPSIAAPVYNQHGGPVPAGFRLTISNPSGTGSIYFTTNGIDPRVSVTGALSSDARPYADATPVVLNTSVVVKARVRNASGNWSALNEAEFQVAELGSPVRITEIMYHPVDGSVYEFIELQNVSATPVDLGNASLAGVEFVFAPGTILAPGTVIVLAPDLNPDAFLARYPGTVIFGLYKNGLANAGERLALLDASGNILTSVEYRDSDPWPAMADGHGWSLELIDPRSSPNDPANWRASTELGGSPGRVNPATAAPSLRLNEIMAYNITAVSNEWGYSDWIEIHNGGNETINLAGWTLSEEDGAERFVFPENSNVTAAGFLVVWFDSLTNASGLHTGFALDRQGETLCLYDPNTNRVDAISFGPQVADYSIGRVGPDPGEWQLNLPTPGVANQPAVPDVPANLVVNEWMANPEPGSDDWLELYNRSTTAPVALQDLYLGTSNAWFQIKSLAFAPPNGYVRLWADEQPGGNHLDFKLPASGGRIDLLDATGQRIDQVTYAQQREGASEGRLPDGAAAQVAFPDSASPGHANYLPVFTRPLLNELMANNRGAVKDSEGRVCDWVELHNPSEADMSLDGMSLSEADPEPGQWTFPTGTILAAKGFLVVWFDEARPASDHWETDLNTGRALSKESGGVYLFNPWGQRLDYLEYGFQVADLSIGRAGDQWQLLDHPTPAGPNVTPAQVGSVGQLKINEWMTSESQADDWFELYNPDMQPVSLSGLFLTDDPSIAGQTKYQVAALSFIGPRSWIKWIADEQVGRGRDHVNFRLDARGETLRLYGTNGTLIESVDYGVQEAGISEGRMPDGAPAIARFPGAPTPAAANGMQRLPTILTQLRSLRVGLGAEARFEVVADGSLPLYYWWQHNGLMIPEATNAVLRLTAVQPAQAGYYRAVVSNAAGTATSTEALLQVERPLTMELSILPALGIVQLQIEGAAGTRYVIEASTNLLDWLPLITNDAPEGVAGFSDSEATNFLWRFYRAIEEAGSQP